MLQVLLLILKIILLVLAAVLGLAVLLVMLVLFVPVRYRAYGKKKEETFLEAKLSWLFHLVSIPINFRDGVLSAKVKVFGFTIMNLAEQEESGEAGDWKEGENTSEKAEAVKNPEVGKEAKDSGEEPEILSPALQEEAGEKENEKAKKGVFRDFVRFLKAVWRFLKEIPVKIRNLKCTFQRFCGKIKRMAKKYRNTKAFVSDERTKAAVRLVRQQAGVLAQQALPRTIRGEVHFGTEDPALTGQILGAIGIFYPIFMDNVKVNPDFEQTVLEGELYLKGRLRMATAVRIAWKLFWDKNVRYVYRMLKL